MKFAAVQMNSNDSVDDNLLLSGSLIRQAKEQGADIVLLPENFAFMGYPKQLVEEIMEDYEDGPIQKTISNLARELEIWVIAGPVPVISSTLIEVLHVLLFMMIKGRWLIITIRSIF